MCLVSIFTLMFFCVVRVCKVSSEVYETATFSNGYMVEINDGRGDFFDSNGERLTGAENFYYVVFLPTDEAIVRFTQEADGTEREDGLKTLRSKKPVVIKSEKAISGVGIYSFKSSQRYQKNLGLEHIIGYINLENDGVMGLEKSYNELLKASSDTELFFSTTASGEFLLGEEPKIINGISKGDVYLTINKNIQKICCDATEDLKMGAVIVTEIATGKIRGIVSKPSFDPLNIKASVNDENSPFVNRALSAYSVGSVFKPLIAAAMLENAKGNYTYNCVGYTDILGIRFYCNNRNGHKLMNLNNAIVNSCNTYFYNAAAEVSPKAFTEIASVLQFGKKIKIANGLFSSAGSVTSLSNLERSKANIANFSIGQGDIALSPLAISNLYSAIANGGYYYSPQLVEGYTENGEYYKSENPSKIFVFSKKTAEQLKQYLINAVKSGTGKNALPENLGAGGKTATAQTGIYNGEEELLNAWFCGFFPEEKPKYSVVVFAEQGSSGSVDSAPIFKKIADEINKIS